MTSEAAWIHDGVARGRFHFARQTFRRLSRGRSIAFLDGPILTLRSRQ
jgi:hypothetical protein